MMSNARPIAVVVAVFLVTSAATSVADGPQPVLLAQAVPLADTRIVPRSQTEIQLSFAPIVAATAPAVVNVYARSIPGERDAFWQQFGDNTRVRQSLGSGVIVDPSGVIITNFHVIANANDIRVALADGLEFPAEVIFVEDLMDLAVLRIPPGATPYPSIPMADSDRLMVGDLVLAIGNPFGIGQTVTSGIVSGLGRTLAVGVENQFFIQTDAAINPGNSGGALIDLAGRLIGINTAIYSRSGGYDGVSFAVPSNLVRLVLNAAMTGDKVHRPWIGAGFAQLNLETVGRLGLSQRVGARVTFVSPDSPAAAVGIAVDDVVVAVDGLPIDHPSALAYRLLISGIGQEVRLGLIRGRSRLDVTVTPLVAPETIPREELEIAVRSPITGARVANLSPLVAQEVGHTGPPDGVIVVAVLGNSFAASSGLERGDVIVSINGIRITTTVQLANLAATNTSVWLIEVLRDGQTMRSNLSIRR